LAISYGARGALIDVNFTVAPASFTALLGLNGAGKSTLFSRGRCRLHSSLHDRLHPGV
jgi:ABC-type Mn2+/Zn2+ transport system ATPase subunit